jgi:hypothetical protein
MEASGGFSAPARPSNSSAYEENRNETVKGDTARQTASRRRPRPQQSCGANDSHNDVSRDGRKRWHCRERGRVQAIQAEGYETGRQTTLLARHDDQSLSRSHVAVVCTSSPRLSFVTAAFRVNLLPDSSKDRGKSVPTRRGLSAPATWWTTTLPDWPSVYGPK